MIYVFLFKISLVFALFHQTMISMKLLQERKLHAELLNIISNLFLNLMRNMSLMKKKIVLLKP